MDKAPNDFGGHKAAAIKACDDAIKEITEAMKFDPKRGEGKPGERKPEAKPADAKPAEPTPATPPAPAGKP
jgi:hypothetical protein